MNKVKIGIVGKGFVGTAVQHGFSPMLDAMQKLGFMIKILKIFKLIKRHS